MECLASPTTVDGVAASTLFGMTKRRQNQDSR